MKVFFEKNRILISKVHFDNYLDWLDTNISGKLLHRAEKRCAVHFQTVSCVVSLCNTLSYCLSGCNIICGFRPLGIGYFDVSSKRPGTFWPCLCSFLFMKYRRQREDYTKTGVIIIIIFLCFVPLLSRVWELLNRLFHVVITKNEE